MKTKMKLAERRNVLHQAYEDQKKIAERRNVLHPAYEDQNEIS
ncbi:hypothetical protein J2S19_001125 [Metabacillus malikii]|uniref:Fur-regulated basic protein B n=1 Tax=Metabacillus malikii TaxID=1504265 RepID=A0ABT9ZC81_9BACI|nr:hypothetical protein [Metabacillus malikii]